MATLSPERWARIERLFDELAELPRASQAEALEALRDSDTELADLLERMLANDGQASDRIAGAIGSVAADLTQPAEWIGHRFGPYEAVREIGRGGMGIVFEAVRADDEYRKRVALKIAPGWRAYPGLVERFRAERQILAELETETIARFLDGGTENGVPYFVMEFVDGEPITDFCARHDLQVRERLLLFRRVCEGVSFAHERLVVHRDLKPANILVTTDGTPKLVDFGVAKLLDEAGDSSTTATSFPAWTPDYVSPEQVRGRPVSPRTDVYSLGLVLYELLCGERGQQGDTSSLLALDRSVCERQPAAPSDRARRRGARGIARQLAGDIDTIVLKAIRKEPDERYSSVAAFTEDIERYLDDRPIRARDVGSAERAVKFVRRHRTAAGFLAVLAGTAAAGIVSTIRQAKRAERRFQQVRSLANTFVFDVHDAIAHLPGSTEARRQIVSTALTYLESLRTDAADDPGLLREMAAAYEKIGTVQGHPTSTNLGDTAGALASYASALRLLEPLVAKGDILAEQLRVSVLHRDAVVRRARGDRTEAIAAFDKAWNAAERLRALRPDHPEVLELAGAVASDMARVCFELRDLERSRFYAGEAMAIAQAVFDGAPEQPTSIDGLATAHSAAGMAVLATGQPEAAAAHFRQVVSLRRRLVSRDPENAEYRRALVVGCGHLSDVLAFRPGENLGDVEGAITALLEAADLCEWARARDPKDRRALYDLANARVRLGALFAEHEPPRLSDAEVELGQALSAVHELLAQDPGAIGYKNVLAAVLRRLGEVLDMSGRPNEAAVQLERAVAVATAMLEGSTGPTMRGIVAVSQARLARIHAAGGNIEAAVAVAAAAAENLGAPGAGAPVLIAGGYLQLGDAYAELARRAGGDEERTQRLSSAHAQYERATTLWRDASLAPALEPRRTAMLALLDERRR